LQHRLKKPESSYKPDARKIEEDSRHFGLIMACFQFDCKSGQLTRFSTCNDVWIILSEAKEL